MGLPLHLSEFNKKHARGGIRARAFRKCCLLNQRLRLLGRPVDWAVSEGVHNYHVMNVLTLVCREVILVINTKCKMSGRPSGLTRWDCIQSLLVDVGSNPTCNKDYLAIILTEAIWDNKSYMRYGSWLDGTFSQWEARKNSIISNGGYTLK